MRDILFKAKRKDNGKWVEGFLFQCLNNGIEWCIGKEPLSANDYSEIVGEYIDWFTIDENTICQYTGLTDKNGRKIWENDVVKCYADTDDLGNDLYFFYKVIWHESYHCWWLSDIHTLEDDYIHQYNSSGIEVIGNIFDNPELLGV